MLCGTWEGAGGGMEGGGGGSHVISVRGMQSRGAAATAGEQGATNTRRCGEADLLFVRASLHVRCHAGAVHL